MEPTLHFGLRDAACALGYPPNQYVGILIDCDLGISKNLLRLPSIHPIVLFDQKFDVAVLVILPLFNGLYAPFSIIHYRFHASLLQTHSGIGQSALELSFFKIPQSGRSF